jgi:tetratricopeptide (TPR) repeat protein
MPRELLDAGAFAPEDEDADEPASCLRVRVVAKVREAFKSGEFPRAAELSEELLSADPLDAAGHAFAAWASVRAGDASDDELRTALSRLDQAVAMDRQCDESVFYRGLMQKRLNNVPAAFRDFARAVQLNPTHTDAETELRSFVMRVRKGSIPPKAR